jgi:hypothetical protein
MLAWSGIVGLGAGIYYYAYRSHPDVLINLFSIWALALALLAAAVLEEWSTLRRRPSAPALAAVFGFAVAACSVAQIPLPWEQVRRLGRESPPLYGDPFMDLQAAARAVAARTRPGERVLVLAPVGHRVAREAGVVNVGPHPGLGQMPTREQLDHALDLLRREGGSTIFVAEAMRGEIEQHLARRGFARTDLDATGWYGAPVFELRRPRP